MSAITDCNTHRLERLGHMSDSFHVFEETLTTCDCGDDHKVWYFEGLEDFVPRGTTSGGLRCRMVFSSLSDEL